MGGRRAGTRATVMVEAGGERAGGAHALAAVRVSEVARGVERRRSGSALRELAAADAEMLEQREREKRKEKKNQKIEK